MLRNTVHGGSGSVSNFPGENVTKVYGSVLLVLQWWVGVKLSGENVTKLYFKWVGGCQSSEKTLCNIMAP